MSTVILALALSACSIQLVAPYDTDVVASAKTLLADATTQIVSERYAPNAEAASYATALPAYAKINGEAYGLLALVSAHENNSHLVAQVKAVIAEIHAMEKTHLDEGVLSHPYLDAKQEALLLEITAVMRTETAKKVLGG